MGNIRHFRRKFSTNSTNSSVKTFYNPSEILNYRRIFGVTDGFRPSEIAFFFVVNAFQQLDENTYPLEKWGKVNFFKKAESKNWWAKKLKKKFLCTTCLCSSSNNWKEKTEKTQTKKRGKMKSIYNRINPTIMLGS